jgi:hypothetical protein
MRIIYTWQDLCLYTYNYFVYVTYFYFFSLFGMFLHPTFQKMYFCFALFYLFYSTYSVTHLYLQEHDLEKGPRMMD